MTEADWLACDDPQLMLEELSLVDAWRRRDRRTDLLCVACARLLWPLLADDVKAAVEWKEATAGRGDEDEEVGDEHGRTVKDATDCRGTTEQIMAPRTVEAAWLCEFGNAFYHLCHSFPATLSSDIPKQLADLLREIFGNPFRPVECDPAWLTSDVVALARGNYEERAFDRMPILADALQDAGCDNEDVLTHCRDPKQVHVRGCWVIDLLLGKV